ncbi:hypothetical protein ACKWTF_007128 [Chironomus riparius]
MSDNNNGSTNEEAWSEEAKSAFLAFKKKKRNLPSPGDVDINSNANKKPKTLGFRNTRFTNRIATRNLILDKNRALNSEDNEPFVADNNIRSSTLSENFVSMDVSELETDKTEVPCDEINKNIAHLREMIANKEDPYAILEKIVQQMADSHKNYHEKITKVTTDCMRHAARHNEQLVSVENRIMMEVAKVHQRSEDRLNAIEFTQKCAVESNIVWLSFADSKEIESLRIKTKSELIREAVKILSRMNIWNNGNNRTIVDVFTQKISIRTENGFENEMIMGVKFLNSFAARDVKRLSAQYAKTQFISKNYDAIRYIVRDNWSSEVWKLLRVCYDFTRIKLIDKASVSDAGIQVFYRKKVTDQNGIEEEKNFKTLIRIEADLDELRGDVNDIGLNIPTFQLYDGNYFKMHYDQRNSYRNSLNTPTCTNINEPLSQVAAANLAC